MAKQTQTKKEEKAILEIMKKYGNNIDLKKSPYLIAEIIKQYGPIFDPKILVSSGPVPGSHGVPPPPPPGPQDSFDPKKHILSLTQQITKLNASIKKLETKVTRIGK